MIPPALTLHSNLKFPMKTQEKMIKTASPFEQNAMLVYHSIVPQKKSTFWQAGQLRPSAATCALNPIMKLIMKLPLFLCLLMTSIATATEDVGDPVVWMDAGSGIEADGKAVASWQSRNGAYLASPPEDASGPEFLPDGIAGKPAIQFGGSAYLSGPLNEELGEEATFIAVVDITSGEESGNVGIMMLLYTCGLSVNQGRDSFYSMMTYWPMMLEKYGEEKALPVRGGILIHCLLSAHIIIADPVFYVVCLSRYGIGEDLVGLEYFLEHLSSLILILALARIEVRMVLLC